jgi:hypothetical protein
MAKLTGTNPDQVPTNADLGDMAYQSKDNASITKIDVPNEGDLTLNPSGGRVNIGDPDGNNNYTLNLVNRETSTSDLARFRNVSTATELLVRSDGGTVIRVQAGGGDKLSLGADSTDHILVQTNGEVQILSGLLELDGNDIGGTEVTIADDAVASITPPRNGGFMFITAGGDGDYPSAELSGGMLYYDVGASRRMDKGTVFGSPVSTQIITTTADVTGTTGTDGNMTVSAQSGVIKIENRNGGARTFQITFL